MNYKMLLNDPKWYEFRKKVYKRANRRCQLCGKTEIQLQAHHSRYIYGKKPWEYDLSDLIALCKPCHSKAAHGVGSQELDHAKSQTEQLRYQLDVTEFEMEQLRDQIHFSESIYKQFIAYIIATKLNGKLDIADNDFSPTSDDYVFRNSYDEKSSSIYLQGAKRVPYDGATAYGVYMSSRGNVASEISEMVNFIELVRDGSLLSFVNRLFYDSKSNCCSIELAPGLEQFNGVAERLLEMATKTIGQFEWFGSIVHGKSLTD